MFGLVRLQVWTMVVGINASNVIDVRICNDTAYLKHSLITPISFTSPSIHAFQTPHIYIKNSPFNSKPSRCSAQSSHASRAPPAPAKASAE